MKKVAAKVPRLSFMAIEALLPQRRLTPQPLVHLILDKVTLRPGCPVAPVPRPHQQYHIVHFATHGALSGQINGNSEPGLLMTPPDVASEEDDGYLTASEIAGLKLDADWVILSACNTAAGGASGAEALSGLARAFFYAQARALLVSHWEVNSDTTVKLITGAMRRLAADKTMGHAEAMRQSMLAMIDMGTPQEAHPAFWAPFVVVGEGGVTATVHSDKRKPAEVHPASWATSTTAGKSSAPH